MDRHQLALECVKIEKAGGSVRDFLRQRGCISPWGTWYRLQREELGRTDDKITEGKGDRKMGWAKLTDAQKEQAVRIAIAGGDPRNYLRDCGSKAPDNLWWKIKRDLKDADPETYAKLPDRIPRAGKQKKPVELVYDPSIEEEYQREQAENAERKEPEERLQEMGNIPELRLKATAAEGMAGSWKRDREYIKLEIQRENKPELVANMSALEWEAAAAELPEVLRLFGMEEGYGIQKLCD